MILIEKNLITKEACEFLKNIALQNEDKATPFRDIHTLNLKKFNLAFANKINNYLTNFLGMRGITAYPELMQVTIWKQNSKHDLHYDTTRDSTNLTSITYLNDDYKGGETAFDNGIIIKPEVGKTVFFDGKDYLHGVNPIIEGQRYVMAIWYTSDLNSIIFE